MYSEGYLRKAEKRYEELYYKGPLGYTDILFKNGVLVTVIRLGQSSLERVDHDKFSIRRNMKIIATDLTEREMVIKLLELANLESEEK